MLLNRQFQYSLKGKLTKEKKENPAFSWIATFANQ